MDILRTSQVGLEYWYIHEPMYMIMYIVNGNGLIDTSLLFIIYRKIKTVDILHTLDYMYDIGT